ncbi:MAG: PepSY domain-containing protein [Caulobacteraceae bacterium]|nr:PepSY domain-containing protein [Caulobacter sp.]
MNVRIVPALVAVAGFAWAPLAWADSPGPGWTPRAQVVKRLGRQGYRVTKIEADDGHWEGEAVRRHVRYEFHVDPHTGRITKMERDRD